jgi:glycosyltransferase involved in cell wall biosynthesis
LEGKFVLGYVGSLFAWEGLELLIEALVQVRTRFQNVKLLIVGSGPDQTAIMESAARHAVSDHVVFAGQIPHEAALAAYAAIDLLVYPRLPMRLTELVTPLKPLEAIAMGHVCVASDVGGHRELMEDEVTGLLFKAGDAAALCSVILRAIEHPDLCRTIAAAGPRAIRRSRTWAQAALNYAEAYGRALGHPVTCTQT